jgi:hypothetical protein
MAAGFQSGITGSRANRFIIDDPVKNREDADSDTVSQKTYDEYLDSVTTRLLPNGQVILIQTRWSKKDLAGRILPEDYNGESGNIRCRDGQVWRVLNLQAKCERTDDPLGRRIGEYLWPEWFPETHWAQWEQNPSAARTWGALFQQRPSLGEGLEFKREWFCWYDPDLPPAKVGQVATPSWPGPRPENLTYYGSSDFATDEDKGDFSEHGIGGVDSAGADGNGAFNLWLVDWWYGQKTTNITTANMVALAQQWHPRTWWNEGGPIDKAMTPWITKAVREARPQLYFERVPLTSIKNKAIKLNSAQAMAEARRIYLPLKRAWAKRLVDQLCDFPAAVYDDAADTLGLLVRGIDTMIQPYDPQFHRKAQLLPFTEAWFMSNEQQDIKPRFT